MTRLQARPPERLSFLRNEKSEMPNLRHSEIRAMATRRAWQQGSEASGRLQHAGSHGRVESCGRAIGDVDGPAPDIIAVYRLQGAAENSLEAE